ncbi:DUF998 domain-containing protein [Microbispora bryophytorum]|uniref:DUF998 domain-containing protein n=1 Tax=Microbispora bryophytorum TaxID=1460882 RepID=UPI003402CAAB
MVDQALLACGLVVGPLFTVAYLAEGATRAYYRPLRHPVSSLALGDRGWTQTANFFVAGLLSLAFAQKERLVAVGGLIQRVSVTIAWAWLAVLAVHTLGA